MHYPIYLDNQATTPVDPRVAKKIAQYMTDIYGNAGSVDHSFGDDSLKAVNYAADQVAKLVSAKRRNVIFTSGATESINLAIKGLTEKMLESGVKPRIGLSPIEHKSVLDTTAYLESRGLIERKFFKIEPDGILNLRDVESSLASGLNFVCTMFVNNEIGTINPIEEIGRLATKYGAYFLCDAAQAGGRIPIEFANLGVSFLVMSAHKMYGPKGIGALIIKDGVTIAPQIHGGQQQSGLRAGTLDVPSIVGMGEACALRMVEMDLDEKRTAKLRDRLLQALENALPLKVNGNLVHRIAGNLNFSIAGIPSKALTSRLRHKLAISTGSACTSGIDTHSHVLQALELTEEELEGAFRISLGKFTNEEQVDEAANLIISEVQNILKAVREASPCA